MCGVPIVPSHPRSFRVGFCFVFATFGIIFTLRPSTFVPHFLEKRLCSPPDYFDVVSRFNLRLHFPLFVSTQHLSALPPSQVVFITDLNLSSRTPWFSFLVDSSQFPDLPCNHHVTKAQASFFPARIHRYS